MAIKQVLFSISLSVFVGNIAVAKDLTPDEFKSWLNANTQNFANCTPTKKGGEYVLCDNTHVSQDELKRLFSMSGSQLLAAIKLRGVETELVCVDGEKSRYESSCKKKSSNQMFNEVSALHGKYLPEKKKIIIRNTASPGSLIHEYIHYLESENSRPIYGQVYKKTRNNIQAQLVKQMDAEIPIVAKLEKEGKKSEMATHLAKFMAANEALRDFAFFQDLIDERNIFLLYIAYGHEFGVQKEDIDLAKRNMSFICKNAKIAKVLPKTQCE